MALTISIPTSSPLSIGSAEDSRPSVPPESPGAGGDSTSANSAMEIGPTVDNVSSPNASACAASPVSIFIPENVPQSNGESFEPSETSGASDAAKLKPLRRANTAERRATHNAVERQRRETLNGRFLDLARLLPNLSQIRRPSKSSIVNSSLAHIHASQRHRLLASRVCLSLAAESDAATAECDALRNELNEWRTRAGLPRVRPRHRTERQKTRGEAYRVIVGGELDVVMAVSGEENGDDEEDDAGSKYGGYSIPVDTDVHMEGSGYPDLNFSRLDAGTMGYSLSSSSSSRRHAHSHPYTRSTHRHERHHRRHPSDMRRDPISIAIPPATVSLEHPATSLPTSMAGIFEHKPDNFVSPNNKFPALYNFNSQPLCAPHGVPTAEYESQYGTAVEDRDFTSFLLNNVTKPTSPAAGGLAKVNPKTDIYSHAQALQALQSQSRSYQAARSPDTDGGSSTGSVTGSSIGRARSGSGSGYDSSSWSPTAEHYDGCYENIASIPLSVNANINPDHHPNSNRTALEFGLV